MADHRVAAVIVANPCVYETIAFDFHMEPIAALFALLVLMTCGPAGPDGCGGGCPWR